MAMRISGAYSPSIHTVPFSSKDMVSDVVLGALIGVGGSVAGYLISGLSALKATEKQIEAQREQLDKQLEAQNEQLETRLESQQSQLETRLDSQQEQLESQITAENQRRRAEYILEREIDAITELYYETEECHSTVQDFAEVMSTDPDSISTNEYYEEVKPKLRSLRTSIRKNGVFLSEDEQKEYFNTVLGQVRLADVEIEWRQNNPGREPPEHTRMDWVEFMNSFNNAESFTRQMLRERIVALEAD